MSQLRARRCCVGRCRRLNGGSCPGGARAPTTCGQGKQDGQENKRSHATEPPPFGHVCKAGRSLPLLAALKGPSLLPWGARPPAFKVQSCRLVLLLHPPSSSAGGTEIRDQFSGKSVHAEHGPTGSRGSLDPEP